MVLKRADNINLDAFKPIDTGAEDYSLVQENDLVRRIVSVTGSQHSETYYRQAITSLGIGLVEELLGELKYHMAKPDGAVKDAARYFTSLIQNQVKPAEPPKPATPTTAGKKSANTSTTSYLSPTALELFEELKPRDAVPTDRGEDRTMDFYSKSAIPWATLSHAHPAGALMTCVTTSIGFGISIASTPGAITATTPTE